MAKVFGPFLSVGASGTVGKILTAAKWKGRAYMKQWFKPANPNTVKQQAVRQVMANAISYWKAGATSADPASKLAWATYGDTKQISGFNAFVSAYMKDNYDEVGGIVVAVEVDPVVPGV